jgi:hypothetical protein
MDKNNYQNDMFPIHPNINENIKVLIFFFNILNNIHIQNNMQHEKKRAEPEQNYGLTKRSRRADNVYEEKPTTPQCGRRDHPNHHRQR